jgi:hypothetical protein
VPVATGPAFETEPELLAAALVVPLPVALAATEPGPDVLRPAVVVVPVALALVPALLRLAAEALDAAVAPVAVDPTLAPALDAPLLLVPSPSGEKQPPAKKGMQRSSRLGEALGMSAERYT